MTRSFTDSPAKRERVPLLIGLAGPSGSGKTYSAQRLARGIVRVIGGSVYGIDTEHGRMLHYAPTAGQPADPDRGTFDFVHVPFAPPFGPLDYLAAIKHSVSRGASVVIVDSFSHEHEGEGGVLDMHEAELDRMAGNDWEKRKRCSAGAWIKPKAERRQLINGVLQMGVTLIACFRAQQKLDWKNKSTSGPDKGQPIDLGWQPIAGSAFIYEMTARALLPPGCDGVPEWEPKIQGEKDLVKRPSQFRELFARMAGKPLSEEMGEEMARWACGQSADIVASPGDVPAAIATAPTPAKLKALWTMLTPDQQNEFKPAFAERKAQMQQRQPGEEG